MGALDRETLTEAKKKFGDEFRGKISDLGYNLCSGIGGSQDSPDISAVIQSAAPIPDSAKRSIEAIFPKNYRFRDLDIPVTVSYIGPIQAANP